MCVKLHTVCELTHSVQNFTGVPCAFNMKKILSLEKFYTHAVTDVTDKYQVWEPYIYGYVQKTYIFCNFQYCHF